MGGQLLRLFHSAPVALYLFLRKGLRINTARTSLRTAYWVHAAHYLAPLFITAARHLAHNICKHINTGSLTYSPPELLFPLSAAHIMRLCAGFARLASRASYILRARLITLAIFAAHIICCRAYCASALHCAS